MRSRRKVLEVKLARRTQQVSELKAQIEFLQINSNQSIKSLEHRFDLVMNQMRAESIAWRQMIEEEFSTLVATATRHISALQEQVERANRREAFVSQELKRIREAALKKNEHEQPELL